MIPFNEGEWELKPRVGHRFHVASVYRHHEAQVRASRSFSGNRKLVQELRAIRRREWPRDEPECFSLADGPLPLQRRHMAGECLYCNKLVVTIKARCQFVAVLQ